MTPKRIVLCADDFGLSPGISRGIAELLELQRVSATSCMVNHVEFAQDSRLLRPFAGRADLGLHFSLTDARAIHRVALACHLRAPRLSTMIGEVERQVGAFADAMGTFPDYIDGHQHVHILPVVREAVVRVAARIGAYVRLTCEPIDADMWRRPGALESAYLARAGRGLERLARQSGVAANSGFRGVRSFREKARFGVLFRRMIADARECSIVMCHPGHPDATLARRDGVVQSRADEWSYLAGPEFPGDLAAAGCTLGRLRDIIPAPGCA